MVTNSDEVTLGAVMPKKTSKTTRLLQAAALTAVLVPLGTVALDAGPIQLLTGSSGTGCYGSGCTGGHIASNTWEFYSGSISPGNFLYSIQISTPQIATPVPPSDGPYLLEVGDWVTTQFTIAEGLKFAGLTCVPTYPSETPKCGLFNVTPLVGEGDPVPTWNYEVAIKWEVKEPELTQWVTILKGPYPPTPPTLFAFDTFLTQSWYYPDPGIGGKGNEFSRFGAFIGDAESFDRWDIPAAVQVNRDTLLPVPDPGSSLVLLGIGLGTLAVRARRWKKQP